MYDPQQVRAEFDASGMREWERLVQSPLDEISLYIHSRILARHLRPGMRVLEIGAGAGRFTQVMTGLGARVTAADLSPVQLELNRKLAGELGFAGGVERWLEIDMCRMDGLDSGHFDAVVAYGGPLSYVLEQRGVALSECLRVLRPGGPLLLSVMSLWGTVHRSLKGVLAIDAETNRKIIASGDLSAETLPRGRDYMHLFRAAELRAWLESAGLAEVSLSASGVLSTQWSELLSSARADEAVWSQLLQMEEEASREPGALDLGTHLIAAGRKAG
jgi:SAM-dependent methyltransferase